MSGERTNRITGRSTRSVVRDRSLFTNSSHESLTIKGDLICVVLLPSLVWTTEVNFCIFPEKPLKRSRRLTKTNQRKKIRENILIRRLGSTEIRCKRPPLSLHNDCGLPSF